MTLGEGDRERLGGILGFVGGYESGSRRGDETFGRLGAGSSDLGVDDGAK